MTGAALAALLAATAWGQASYSQLLEQAQNVQLPGQRVTLYTQALAAFDHQFDQPADLATAYVGRAYAYGDMKKYDEGLQDAAKAEKIAPEDWTVHKVKAYLLADAVRCDPSTAAYVAALKRAPESEKDGLYRELGIVLRDCSKAYPRAEQALMGAVAYATKTSDVQELFSSLRAIAALVCKGKRYEEALELFDRSLKIADDTGTLYDKGVCEQAAGLPGDAKDSFTEVITRMESLDSAGKQYAESHREEAEGTLKVVAVDTEILPDCYERRGKILRAAGDPQAAAADFARACELGRASACPKKRKRRG